MRVAPLLHALLAAGLLVGCGGTIDDRARDEGVRELPRDRGRTVTYVALGDSTVAGEGATRPANNYVSLLGERLGSVYPGARLTNLGRGGATAADVRATQLEPALRLSPDLVTLSVGPNDITRGRDVRRYEDDVAAILAALARATRGLVVVNLIPDLTLTPRYRGTDKAAALGPIVARFNEALSRQATAHGANVVDLYRASREELPKRPELIAADGYHPSDRGYARWAELMWRSVESHIPR